MFMKKLILFKISKWNVFFNNNYFLIVVFQKIIHVVDLYLCCTLSEKIIKYRLSYLVLANTHVRTLEIEFNKIKIYKTAVLIW